MRCPACLAEHPDGAKFCSSCGQSLGASCSNCGAPYEHPEARFCAECGARLGGDVDRSPAAVTGTAPIRLALNPIWLGVGAAMVVAVIVAVVLAGGGDSLPDPFEADSCEELADVGIAHMQAVLDEYGDAASEEDPRVSQADDAFEARLELLASRAEALGCDLLMMEQLMCQRASQLGAEGAYARELLFEVRQDVC